MGKDSFAGRRNELEEKFFREKDMELIRAMREKTATMERKKALAEASGIEHDDLLDQLQQLRVSIQAIREVVGYGRQAIVLVPEMMVGSA